MFDPIITQRLTLRRWQPADAEAFADLNADSEVMRYFPSTMTRDQSEALIVRIQREFEQHGFGLWAVEVPGVADFIGFVGLAVPRFEAHFMPAVEVGWRLARRHWGNGYATEAARAAADFGFDQAELAEIVSFTTPLNARSRRVMERLGMTHDAADDFDHPSIPEGNPLRRHVLYRLHRPTAR